jgi:enamine deaminase RidA (YjgF/YER057c/UK114 family)
MIERFDVGPRLSEMVVHQGIAYLAGQVPDTEDADITTQTREVLASIDALLARAGSDRTKILRAEIFLADLADFAGMNAVWDAWVPPGHAPARATVQAKLARPGWRVEIVVTAAV